MLAVGSQEQIARARFNLLSNHHLHRTPHHSASCQVEASLTCTYHLVTLSPNAYLGRSRLKRSAERASAAAQRASRDGAA